MSQQEFERLLLEAVDEGLSSLSGSVKQAIYYHLERLFGVKREDIPNNVEAFADALEKIFGQGADFLEVMIMKKLHEKSGISVKGETPESFEFTEYVATTRRSYLEKRAKQTSEKLVHAKS